MYIAPFERSVLASHMIRHEGGNQFDVTLKFSAFVWGGTMLPLLLAVPRTVHSATERVATPRHAFYQGRSLPLMCKS